MARAPSGLVPVGWCPVTGQRFTPAQVAAWVQASCEAQGVPVVVADPGVVSDVVALATGRVAGPADRAPQGADAGPLTAAS